MADRENNDLIDRKALLLDLSQNREDGTFVFSEEQVEAADKIARYVYSRIIAQPAVPGLSRVLTLEEVETAEFCMEPVFVEMLDENGKPQETPDLFSWRFVRHITPLTDGKIYVLNNFGFSSALYEETYGTTWRCWTSRPTDEQRKAVKWDE